MLRHLGGLGVFILAARDSSVVGLTTLANPGCRRFCPSNYSTGKKSGYKLNFRAAPKLAAPLCDIAMSFVMALSSCNHNTGFSGINLSLADSLTHSVPLISALQLFRPDGGDVW
jgi:hypothetical protein